ncbi:PREDICTED: BRI1 kinase inhibitor 1-like [Ipomoea nil]|uniref:BRI1 kinase inhibitor 1-like n=1 Tax=Ipomoea nil TaxID=35883 RepID=UPI000900AE45|nr:PREDICTED: BRI1 kinase inhibitor 1-like [Ipomoea nil]
MLRIQEEPPSQPPPAATTITSSVESLPSPPPSAASSPSHEFSFTISLHPPSSTKPAPATGGGGGKTAKSSPASFAVDLSPADEIFFHGHLLPLHLLSHLPVSPRSSTTSMDSFTLPIKDQNFQAAITTQTTNDDQRTDAKSKPKSFSLFGLPKRRKACGEVRDKEDKEKHWRKLKYDVTQAVKRYMRMVRPLLSFKGRRRTMDFHHRQTHSFSGNLNIIRRGGNRSSDIIRGFRGEYSAPASTTTSPTNSGLLVAPSTFSSPSDSTMEELQAAIQAAIAHCKKSIAMEENEDQMPRKLGHIPSNGVSINDPKH